MAAAAFSFTVETRGFCDIHDITPQVREGLCEVDIDDGLVCVSVPGSTAAVSTIEHEDGALRDLQDAIERLAPQDRAYAHDARWGDGNGFAHVRAALLGPSITVPRVGGRLQLGTWQQIILLDFDNRPRSRDVAVQIAG